jgi:arylsulfatase A-like enzyme
MAFLETAGLKEDTAIIFTSDHGEYLGDHYQVGKRLFFDQTMRIPYIVYDPSPEADASRGKILDNFVESIDSPATILDLLGKSVPYRYQGHSLKNILYGKDTDWRTEIYFEADYRSTAPHSEAGTTDPTKLLWVVRDHSYKYIQFADPEMPPLLYDLRADPGEMNNIAENDSSVAVLFKYAQKLLCWRMQNEDQGMQVWFDDVKRKK